MDFFRLREFTQGRTTMKRNTHQTEYLERSADNELFKFTGHRPV